MILDNLRFGCGDYFSNENYRTSLFRLLNLQFFKFVNIRFEQSMLSDSLLEAHVLLTPAVPQKVEASLSGIFSPNNYFGAQTGLSWQHRNAFGSAENLRFVWDGALLRLKDGDTQSTLFSSDTKTQLTLPQKIPGLRSRRNNALSATKFSLAHNLLYYRTPFVDSVMEEEIIGIAINELEAEGGFVWKKNRQGTITHELNPLNLTLRFVNISIPGVKNRLLENILVAETEKELSDALFAATLLEIKPNYAFVFDDRLGEPRKWSTLFRQRFSFLSSKFLLPDYIDAVADLGFSLNIFTESDFRQYINVTRKATLAWRFSLFAGLPVKEGSIISPTNLYTVGGASSVRSVAPRSIGPGASVPFDDPESDDVFSLLTDHTGNLMLLSNVELRRKLGKSWEVAAFVDAGNVWLTEPDEKLPGGEFSGNRFYKELASGAGAGIRFTLGFFILRLDLAIPITKPYLPLGSRLIGQPGFGGTGLRVNLAFGYPF
ncbi:MAG: BamA/TamA family outer membrane protein [Saprospiraceae bacterium]|nr:BamA/TamA family outer membrane protein [Saprospiraceae bacterium]